MPWCGNVGSPGTAVLGVHLKFGESAHVTRTIPPIVLRVQLNNEIRCVVYQAHGQYNYAMSP